jgi:hypothetical protein
MCGEASFFWKVDKALYRVSYKGGASWQGLDQSSHRDKEVGNTEWLSPLRFCAAIFHDLLSSEKVGLHNLGDITVRERREVMVVFKSINDKMEMRITIRGVLDEKRGTGILGRPRGAIMQASGWYDRTPGKLPCCRATSYQSMQLSFQDVISHPISGISYWSIRVH